MSLSKFFGVICLVTGVLLCYNTAAQPVQVQAYTDKNKVLLGEPFWLTLEVKMLNDAKPQAFELDSIPHFEFLTRDSISNITKGDTNIYRQHYQLLSFDSGRWVIPSFTYRPFVKTASILVDVVYTDPFDPSQPYHDVQELKEIAFKLEEGMEKWWYASAVFLILLTLLIHWLTRERKPKPVQMQRAAGTAYQRAKAALKQLKTTEANCAILYTGPVDILRTYLLERTGISSLQETASDLVEKIKPFINDKERYRKLSEVLLLSNLVKFAKYTPSTEEALRSSQVVEDAIDYLEVELGKK